ncbi:Type IV secretion system protein VirB11 [Maliponia aquimaris]|uniref:Type IV secretion system protein VirB11 n=1 Tax=Maliponia aquimaris TaxID=1673631 RepID=A0A238L1I6_9RHOB|nr:Type IV secretion system protein VirB11 [Maliponia aquimaris]
MNISGGTSTGRTVAARKILSLIPPEERIITIEEPADLRPEQSNTVTLIADRDSEARSADVPLDSTLRMRPDRIVPGEVRGHEAMTFLETINPCHRRWLTTRHAEPPQRAFRRLAIAILKTDVPMTYADLVDYVEGSIDVINQAGRRNGARGITEVFLPGRARQNADTAGGAERRAVAAESGTYQAAVVPLSKVSRRWNMVRSTVTRRRARTMRAWVW